MKHNEFRVPGLRAEPLTIYNIWGPLGSGFRLVDELWVPVGSGSEPKKWVPGSDQNFFCADPW